MKLWPEEEEAWVWEPRDGSKSDPLVITPNNSLGDFVLSIFATLGSTGLEALVLKGGTLLSADTIREPLNYKLQLPPEYFWIPCVHGPAGEESV